MPASDHLSPEEFEQTGLFDPVTQGYAQHGPVRPEPAAKTPRYMQTLQQSSNPIYSEQGEQMVEETMDKVLSTQPDPREEFVPTYELSSPQKTVNPFAVSHLAEHSTGLDAPNINVARRGSESVVYDGNHRVNAALRRGQMLIPADVYQY